MKNKIRFIVLLYFSLNSSCHFEVDTVDPQVSPNIEASKKDGFFVSEYKVQQIPRGIFEIKEAWVEHVWKNKIKGTKVKKIKADELQLNLKIENLNSDFNNSDYLLNWRMDDQLNNSFGESDGVYVLFLKTGNFPDSVIVTVNKIKEDRRLNNIFQFVIIKK